jgi:tetratricopeptide (TPR) repeat protein
LIAASPPPPQVSIFQQIAPEDSAALLIQKGDYAGARKLLLTLEKTKYKPNEVQFLLGMLDVQDRAYASAIRRFRRILVSEPGVVRVRLELARAFFAKGDYQNAERQFRLARAGKLPKAAIANIDSYLNAIRRLRRYSYNFSVAIAPDTNLNAGPALESVTLYGLPFQLSAQAKQQSGVGLAVDMGGEWAAPVTSTLKLRLGAQLDRSQYDETAFDDMSISVHAGPRLTLRRWDFNWLVTGADRWFGDRPYSTTVGTGVDATYYLSSRTGLSMGVNYNHVDYPYYAFQTGPVVSAAWGVFHALSTVSILSATAVLSRTAANDAGFSNWAQQVGVTYSYNLRGGITLSASPSYTRAAYDAPIPAFGVKRMDNLFIVQISVLDRALDFRGFTPRVTYSFSRNDSNVPIYSFTRNRIEMGVTRFF